MIKGLYFKLNIDKEEDKEIYDFFNNEKIEGFSNIEQLREVIRCYKYICKSERIIDLFESKEKIIWVHM